MSEFNLIDKLWIPCIDLDGKQVEYGIRDTLTKAHELREICDDSPLVTVAIHRLLLAILYRAFQGPSEMKEWKTLYRAGSFASSGQISVYLSKWYPRFYLFDGEYPFYQMAGLSTKKPVSVNRLATESASGNNATLFDHSGDDDKVAKLLSHTARQLIACQSFALGFGKSGNAVINGVEEQLPYSADAIGLRGMCVWMQGEKLFDTLMMNFSLIQTNTEPPWELDNTNQDRDRLNGKDRIAVSSRGIVDRYTWQSRLVNLIPDGTTVSNTYFTQGRSADKSHGDPMKVYRSFKQEGISALSLSNSKAAWRDSHSILMIPPPNSNEQRPECFNLLARVRRDKVLDDDSQFVVHVAGLASAPNKAGKFLLWRHERMPVPAALLSDVNLIERLGGLIQNAENVASELNRRTRRIAKLFLAPNAESPEGGQPDKDEVTRITDSIDPRPAYWSRLEQHFYTLLEKLPNDWDSAIGDWKPDDQQTATNTWRGHVKHEARRALEESIKSLGTTARAIQAVARVRTDFNDDDLKSKQPKSKKAKGGSKRK